MTSQIEFLSRIKIYLLTFFVTNVTYSLLIISLKSRTWIFKSMQYLRYLQWYIKPNSSNRIERCFLFNCIHLVILKKHKKFNYKKWWLREVPWYDYESLFFRWETCERAVLKKVKNWWLWPDIRDVFRILSSI